MRILEIVECMILALMVSGCFKEDQPVPKHPRGDVRSDTIEMSQTYKYQVYYELDSVGSLMTNDKKASDLGFECSPEGWHILLNTADFMVASDLGEVPFGVPQDTSLARWRFDRSDGNLDSTAVGTWYVVDERGDTVSNRHVYAINRGMDDQGKSLGYVQVIFDSLKRGTYYFRFALLSGGVEHRGTVIKDVSVNYLWFSLDNGGSVQTLEPDKSTWDILFTQYTTMLFTDLGEPYPYLVTGVLLNRTHTAAALDTLNNFDSLSYQIAQQVTYSENLDAIGYNWKYYNFEAGNYTVRMGVSYLIRNRLGNYYKLRFVGFYNNLGQKGFPAIEYQRL